MLPAYLVSVVMMLILALTSVTFSTKASLTEPRQDAVKASVDSVTKAVEEFYFLKYRFPNSVFELKDELEFADLRTYVTSDSELSRIYVLPGASAASDTDSELLPTYKTAAVVASLDLVQSSESTLESIPDVQKVAWSVLSERKLYPRMHVAAVRQQELLADAITKRYLNIVKDSVALDSNALHPVGTAPSASTPSVVLSTYKSASVPPSINSVFGVPSLGTGPGDCQGIFLIFQETITSVPRGIPLHCSAFYNYYGNPVKYKKLSLNKFTIESDSVFKDGTTGAFRTLRTTVEISADSSKTISMTTTES